MAATNIEQGFQESLKRFQARLSSRERDNFKHATLKDLQRAVLQIQARQAAKADAMNLRRIQKFLEAFEQLGKIVDVFLNASEFVAFVWGPMKFLLQIASNFADAFDTLLSAYEQIGESIPLFEQYRELFNGKSHMDEALARIYDDILEFHRRALRFFTLPTWRQVFRSAWKDFNVRFGGLLGDLRRHKTLIESQANILHFQRYQADRKTVFEQLDRLETDERKRKFTDLMQWLAGTDSLLDHEDVCQVRRDYPGSGVWLLKQQVYTGWRMDSVPSKSMLWLNGGPGTGKTVLASLVVENCQKDLDAATAFFYCKYGDPQKTTCVAVLRTLLGQLLRHDHVLLPWLYDQHLASGQLVLTSEELCRSLLEAVLLSASKVYLVVDGLDECDKLQRKSLLSKLSGMVTICDNQDPGKLRIMVVSQNEPDIRKGMSLYSEIALKASDSSNDIERFVKVWSHKIQERFELEDDQRDSISELTCQGAEGMFLFAKLVMLNLHAQINVEQLCQQIRRGHFPDGIGQAYERIFDRIKKQSREDCLLAKTVLGWMTCARRPLKWHEVQGAFAIRVNDTQDVDVDFQGRKPRTHVRDVCGSLVTQLPGDRLELVHHTARQYLIDSSFIQPHVIECHLAMTCLNYLTFECFDTDLSNDDRRGYLIDGYYAFQDYAVTHWPDHLLSVIRKGPDLPLAAFQEIEKSFASAITNFVAQYQLFEYRGNGNSGGEGCKDFRDFDFYHDLYHAYCYIQDQKSHGLQVLDAIGPRALGQAVDASRSMLENLGESKTLELATSRKLVSFYGLKWYKCSKATCFYFHEGFRDSKLRATHDLRHEIPFRCLFEDCETGYKLGFTKQKDLEKHMGRYHPELGKAALSFARPNKAQAKDDVADGQNPGKAKKMGKHVCRVCGKSYARANILRSHVLTHNGEMPFRCSVCGTGFVRDSERKRHEVVHSGAKEFVCQGELDTIPPSTWGCGKKFFRQDALNSHHRSVAGKACLARKLEAEKLARQRQSRFKGWMLPLSDAIRERHPEFQVLQYDQLITPGAEVVGTPRSSEEDLITQPESFVMSQSEHSVTPQATDSAILYDEEFLTPRPQSSMTRRDEDATTPSLEQYPSWPVPSFRESEALFPEIEMADNSI